MRGGAATRKLALFLLLAVSLPFAFAGCARIRFVREFPKDEVVSKAPMAGATQVKSQSYPIAVFGLANFADPANLSEYCPGGDWKAATSEVTFSQALVHVLSLNLESSWTTTIECR